MVTGGSSGIGKATVALLRTGEYEVVSLSRHCEKTNFSYPCDVRKKEEVKQVMANIRGDFGRIDVLVNSAGISATTKPLDVTAEEWQDIFQTNVLGVYWCCQQVLPIMRERRYGRIVNVSSIAGRLFSQNGSVAYTASKYAVVGLTRHLASQFGAYGIYVNCVCPSLTKTEMMVHLIPESRQKELADQNPLKRLAEPGEVAEVIAFLASDQSSYINGAILDVNGGLL